MKQEFMYIGNRIKKAREAKGITMLELGNRCDVSEQHIGLIERCRSGISIPTLIKVASALEVTTDSLLIKSEESKSVSYQSRDTLNFLLDGVTEKEMSFIIDFIRLYREKHPLPIENKDSKE